MKRIFLTSVSSFLVLVFPAGADTTVSSVTADQNLVCAQNPDQKQELIVSQKELVKWLAAQDGLRIVFTDPNLEPLDVFTNAAAQKNYLDHLASAKIPGNPSPAEKAAAQQKISDAIIDINALGELPDNKKNRFRGMAGFDANLWLTQNPWQRPFKIVCNAAYGASTSQGSPETSWLDNVRVRGVPDTLTVGRTSGAFAAADKASISFSDDGVKNTQTSLLQATLGYDIDLGGDSTFIPYGTINRNVAQTKGSSAVSVANYYDFGAIVAHDISAPDFVAVLSARPHYLANDNDGSRLFGVHLEGKPVFNHLHINDYAILGDDANADPLRYMFLFDLRGDANYFTDRGTAPATNLDYLRLGTRFGANANIRALQSNITVTDTWMYGVSGALKRLNDFQASWTYSFNSDPTKQYFGISLTYKKGNIEATGQPEQSWLVSLTGKY